LSILEILPDFDFAMAGRVEDRLEVVAIVSCAGVLTHYRSKYPIVHQPALCSPVE